MTLSEFFVIVPSLHSEKHAKTLPLHLAHVAEKVAKREFYRQSGEYFSPQITGEQTEIIPYAGSAFAVVAESEEDVKSQLVNDPFSKEGVWDVAAARIFHFKTGDTVPINYPPQQ